MVRIIVGIEGMACEHCEAQVNDTVRTQFDVKKVTASHEKKEAVIIAENELDPAELTAAITAQGYKVTGVKSEPYEKKSFSLFK